MLKYRDIQKYFNDMDVGQSIAQNIKKVFDVTFRHGLEADYIRDTPMRYVRIYTKPREIENKEVKPITK